jgi:hypothetical protein
MTKRVWILGAGFSRSLGAPLLNDLLSFRLRHRLLQAGYLINPTARGLSEEHSIRLRLQDLIYGLFHHGMGYPEGYAFQVHKMIPQGERGLWHHAEEYLELLDGWAASDSGDSELESVRSRFHTACEASLGTTVHARRVSSFPIRNGDARKLLIEARRIIAAECSEFLRNPNQERLKPYLRWLRMLTSEDTIITFNYDCLLEKVAAQDSREIAILGAEKSIGCQHIAAPTLLKLHGSVDWKMHQGADFPCVRAGDIEFATQHPGAGFLCTPGGSKLLTTNSLKPLWTRARNAIIHADRVYFIGYRIPESDAAAREMILEALRQSTADRPVRIILGAAPHPDSSRLATLVKMVGREVQDERLWAQDFLAAWTPSYDNA